MSYSNEPYGNAAYQVGPQMISVVDPFVYQALMGLNGKQAVIETVRGSVRGIVMDVKPDHIVIQMGESTFFVRLQQIVWIMPA